MKRNKIASAIIAALAAIAADERAALGQSAFPNSPTNRVITNQPGRMLQPGPNTAITNRPFAPLTNRFDPDHSVVRRPPEPVLPPITNAVPTIPPSAFPPSA